MKNIKSVVCYTDGACSNNPGSGGFGIVFIQENTKRKSDKVQCFYGGSDFSTNNRMELTAVIEAIKIAKRNKIDKLQIYSDSAYVVSTMQNNWIAGWKQNNWMTAQKKLVKNKDLWLKLLDVLDEKICVEFYKIKGHAGEEYNELADKLAVKGSEEILTGNISIGGVYKC